MKNMVAVVFLGFAFVVSTSAVAGTQQEKMKGCNKEAKESGLKGDERKAFMSKCLKKDYVLKSVAGTDDDHAEDQAASAVPATSKAKQREKMKSCNAEAKSKALKGDERKEFMSACLKG